MNCQKCNKPLPSGGNFCPNCGAQVPASAAEPISRIDFSQYIADRTKDFTGREWAFTEMNAWLTNPQGERFFIITGEPGIRKAGITEWLKQVFIYHGGFSFLTHRPES